MWTMFLYIQFNSVQQCKAYFTWKITGSNIVYGHHAWYMNLFSVNKIVLLLYLQFIQIWGPTNDGDDGERWLKNEHKWQNSFL